jgi:hypothetical protein
MTVLGMLTRFSGPVGLHDAERGLLDRQHEPDVGPELAHRVPRLHRRGLDDEPALVADAGDLRVGRRVDGDSLDGARAVACAARPEAVFELIV